MKASAKVNQEDLLAERSARMDTNLNEMRKEIKSNQAEMRSTICAFRSELNETIQHEMKAVIQPIRAELDETTDCNGATEIEPDPGMMQSIEEHQEIPKGRPQQCRSEDRGIGVRSEMCSRGAARN
jgi:signal transduction histidine kinase